MGVSRLALGVGLVLAGIVLVGSTAGAAGQPRASWRVVEDPYPISLSTASCIGPTSCVAVGGTTGEEWNGTGWSLMAGATPQGTLYDVSCVTTQFCVAVGSYGAGSSTLVMTWNGTTWSVTPSPNPSTAVGSFLSGVTCKTATYCVTVGSWYYDITVTNPLGGQSLYSVYEPLIETWDGSSWKITPSPNPTSSPHDADLYGVSCKSVRFCVAVGTYDNFVPIGQATGPNINLTLVEMWNGRSWTITPSPNQPDSTSAQYNELQSVSCATKSDCMAVGATGEASYGDQRNLIEAWNGSIWTIQTNPNQGDPTANEGEDNNGLVGVSCNRGTCVAVGEWENYAVVQPQTSTLIETWDGTSWSLTPSPNLSNYDNFLYGVSCKGGHCLAVGGSENYGSPVANPSLVLQN